MSLILAVEPDRRQAKQLSSVVRQHVRAELIVAESGAAALNALGGRVPDLILTPPLLPPKDEAVLTSWLRDLGDAAAHVQTLAIPILAEASARKGGEPSSPGIFGRLRDQPKDAAAPGCDPGMFADQIRVYLDRAGSERTSRTPGPSASEQAPIAAAPEEAAPEVEELDEAVTFDDLVFDPGPSEPAPAPAPVPVSEPPVVMRQPTPFARPDKRVEPEVLRSWEEELGLEATVPVVAAPATPNPVAAKPLWKVGHADATPIVPTVTVPTADLAFDPQDTRYAALFRRLDEVASSLHA
jgi:CheY-like chemotaxis protein